MNDQRSAVSSRRERAAARRRLAGRAGFTLIEIMIVVGIMAIIFAISLPSIGRQLHKDSMRTAVSEVLDACSKARERAILTGTTTEVHIRPLERTITVTDSSSPATAAAGEGGATIGAGRAAAGLEHIPPVTISDHISFYFIAVNEEEDLQEVEEVGFRFHPNGTADQVDIVLRSDENEARGIAVDVITGIASVEDAKNGR